MFFHLSPTHIDPGNSLQCKNEHEGQSYSVSYKGFSRISATGASLNRTRGPKDHILGTGLICYRRIDRLRACDTIEAKIMKCHVLSLKLAEFCRRVCCLEDQTEPLDGFSLLNTTENNTDENFFSFRKIFVVPTCQTKY